MKNLFFILFIGVLIVSCGKTVDSDVKFKRESLTGFVQKGPFINGTRVNLQELNQSFRQTGNVFSTEMTSNAGRFEIRNIELESSYALLSANGFYFNEVKGEISEAPLTLNGLVDLSEASTVNLNILTHLMRPRIEHLLSEGQTFLNATRQARDELLGVFGFSLSSDESAESFDISQNVESAAILLAVSVILQGSSGTGELSELLATFSDNFRTLGVITNPQILTKLRLNAINLDYDVIQENLINRYQNLGESASIPDFREKVSVFLQRTGEPPTIEDVMVVNISSQAAKITAMVNPNSLKTEVLLLYGTGEVLTDSLVIANPPISGEGFQKVEASLVDLVKNTSYNFKLLASNVEGEVTSGDNTLRTLDQFDVSIEVQGEGEVDITVVQAKTTPHDEGTVLELTANPVEGWAFQSWGGDLSGNENPKVIVVDTDKQVTARFFPTVYLSDNGITIMCPNGNIGEIREVNGVKYEVVDNSLLRKRRDERADMSKLCTSLVTDMANLFSTDHSNNWRAFNQPIGNWDVSNVTNMRYMFFATNFNQPIGDWDVSSVTTMANMFEATPFNQPIGNWDVSSVTDLSMMFWSNNSFNQPIGNWDVRNVKYMRGTFLQTPFNQPIGNWNVSNVENMSYMFTESAFNQPIGNWDVSSVTNMVSMFMYSQFNQPIGNWNVSNVGSMDAMFSNSMFNQNISKWCVNKITEEPDLFSSSLTPQNKPVWGTCPTR